MSLLIANREYLTDEWLVKSLKFLDDSLKEALPENCLMTLTFEKFGLNFCVTARCIISGRDLFTAKMWVPRDSFDWHQLLSSLVIGKLLETLSDIEEPTDNVILH